MKTDNRLNDCLFARHFGSRSFGQKASVQAVLSGLRDKTDPAPLGLLCQSEGGWRAEETNGRLEVRP